MTNRDEKFFVRAIPMMEGALSVDEANEPIRFMYGSEDDPSSIREYELDLSEKLEITFGNEPCFYVPVFRIDDGERNIRRVVLLSNELKITSGEQPNIIASMSPKKENLTPNVWEETKSDIRKRHQVIGGTATGGAIFLAGAVIGTVWAMKRIKQR